MPANMSGINLEAKNATGVVNANKTTKTLRLNQLRPIVLRSVKAIASNNAAACSAMLGHIMP